MLKCFIIASSAIQPIRDENGQDLIEYGLIGAMISVACIALMAGVAAAIQTLWTNILSDFS